jgi:hypothetical protein
MNRGRAFFFHEAATCLDVLRSAPVGEGADLGRARRLPGAWNGS